MLLRLARQTQCFRHVKHEKTAQCSFHMPGCSINYRGAHPLIRHKAGRNLEFNDDPPLSGDTMTNFHQSEARKHKFENAFPKIPYSISLYV